MCLLFKFISENTHCKNTGGSIPPLLVDKMNCICVTRRNGALAVQLIWRCDGKQEV